MKAKLVQQSNGLFLIQPENHIAVFVWDNIPQKVHLPNVHRLDGISTELHSDEIWGRWSRGKVKHAVIEVRKPIAFWVDVGVKETYILPLRNPELQRLRANLNGMENADELFRLAEQAYFQVNKARL